MVQGRRASRRARRVKQREFGSRIVTLLRRLMRSREGIVSVAIALIAVPLIMVLGAAVDYARLEQFKTQLQATVDSAALSGAAAYVDASQNANAVTVATNYVTSNVTQLPGHIGTITPTVTASEVTTGTNQGFTVTVNATATLSTTFMRIVTPTMKVSASATAVNPVVKITISASHFSSSAADANTLWYWLVSASDPNAVPDTSQITGASPSQKLASNQTSNNGTVSFTAAATQKIGMALQNVTGWNYDYGCTQYQTKTYKWEYVRVGWYYQWQYVEQSCRGTTQWFFSNVMPPSNNTYNEVGYQNVTTNCSLEVTLTNTLPTLATAPVSGQCFTSLPKDSYPSCADLNGQYANFFWNDMGGNTDDYDYNDAEISIQCDSLFDNGATNIYLAQ